MRDTLCSLGFPRVGAHLQPLAFATRQVTGFRSVIPLVRSANHARNPSERSLTKCPTKGGSVTGRIASDATWNSPLVDRRTRIVRPYMKGNPEVKVARPICQIAALSSAVVFGITLLPMYSSLSGRQLRLSGFTISGDLFTRPVGLSLLVSFSFAVVFSVTALIRRESMPMVQWLTWETAVLAFVCFGWISGIIIGH